MKGKDVFYGKIEFWNGNSFGFIRPDAPGATQLGGHSPEGIARLLIRELVAGDRPDDAA